ncbi:hypothetical protein UMM65_13365 [Aureibaculum sp. 2210JD6-5]|uniref:hypothetical protein n=1 Tax=Aureibaculum sp. 2210JD6-5 TaxID=3103957 RepID=UPI002AAEC322|nr:hypothetical protein [Aureibaculum sp. 2210JD6-5]MDY7396233.1 hypothetical protein [Aureibaculum sp. 2210JD6-5]
MKSKKFWILVGLFIMPLVFYLLILTGTNNFAKLPVLNEKIGNVTEFKNSTGTSVTLDNKITVLCFLGNDLKSVKNNALNLNEKIYKHFYKFKDFQFVAVLQEGTSNQVNDLVKQLKVTTDMQKWNFVYGNQQQIKKLFNSLDTSLKIDANGYSPYAFIIDKNRYLRGRTDDEDNGLMYGYNAETVAPIHGKMVDDVKVLIAEYRLELKKNKREI